MSQLQLSFHNTIKINGKELQSANAKCNDQEMRIMGIMLTGWNIRERIATPFTPFQVSDIYNSLYDPIPITSIRRAMTNLERAGKLEKIGQMKMERYGKPNHLWRVKSN